MNFEVNPASWAYWPEQDDLPVEFQRLLAAAQDGGSTIAECLLAAGKIKLGDHNSWYREWKSVADRNKERGNAALGDGNLITAQSNWLRAINYYKASAFPLDPADKRQRAALMSMRECARSYLQHCTPAGEVITIPWRASYPLQAYFLPARAGSRRAPAVICVGEPGRRKEELLFKLGRHARDRGLSVMAVDMLGEGTGDRLEEVIGSGELESAISHVMDHVAGRDDVDEHRVAILADECESSFVARSVVADARFAAAVCDGGLWDLQERAFLAGRQATKDADIVPDLETSRIARNMRCPLLITLGEQGWLKADRIEDLIRRLKMSHSDITLKIFEGSETAAAQGHADNPTLANEFIFDWIASRLGVSGTN